MTLFIAVAALVLGVISLVQIYQLKKEGKKEEKPKKIFKDVLKEMQGKNCEIVVKTPMMFIDVPYSVKGQITDSDDEWLLLSGRKGKKTVQRIFRISLIKDIKELVNY